MIKSLKARLSPRVVIDTNVWLSALVFGGSPGKVLELFVSESIVIIISEELLSELRRTVMGKFPTFIPHLELLEASIRCDAMVVKLGSTTVKVSRDSDDDKVLETALVGGCTYIISGDKDLLSLRTYQNIHLVTPTEFLKGADFD